MKTAFLLYRPVLDYEESISPHMIFTTRQAAQAALDAMIAFANRLISKFPELGDDRPDNGDYMNPKWNPYFEAIEKRDAILEHAAWPYGISLRSDICTSEDRPLCSSVLEIMELPLNPTPIHENPHC